MKKHLIAGVMATVALMAVQGCSSTEEDKGKKSPCVAADIGDKAPATVPCGPRRSVNIGVS